MHGDPAFISIGAGFGIECDRNIAGSNIVLYLKITGPYASEGVLQKKIRKIYRKFQQDAKIPGDAYCVRIKITHDEEGNDWNYLKIYILLKPES